MNIYCSNCDKYFGTSEINLEKTKCPICNSFEVEILDLEDFITHDYGSANYE